MKYETPTVELTAQWYDMFVHYTHESGYFHTPSEQMAMFYYFLYLSGARAS